MRFPLRQHGAFLLAGFLALGLLSGCGGGGGGGDAGGGGSTGGGTTVPAAVVLEQVTITGSMVIPSGKTVAVQVDGLAATWLTTTGSPRTWSAVVPWDGSDRDVQVDKLVDGVVVSTRTMHLTSH